MGTGLTQYLNWDKPVFPSDNAAAELSSLIDQIDFDANQTNVELGNHKTNTSNPHSVTDVQTGAKAALDDHSALVDPHHTRYTDTEAVNAIGSQTSLDVDITGDADTVDGKHAYELGNVDKILLVRGTNNDINNNANVTWNTTEVSDSPYTFDGTTVTIEEAGMYEIRADADFHASNSRVNPNFAVQKNGSTVGVMGRSGYIRNSSGHDHSSIHTSAVLDLVVGDTIRIRSSQEAQGNNVVPDRSHFYIRKLFR